MFVTGQQLLRQSIEAVSTNGSTLTSMLKNKGATAALPESG
jgi:hypothetical protein